MAHGSWLTPHGPWLMAHGSNQHDWRSTSRADGSEGCFQGGDGGGDQGDDDGCRPAGPRSLYQLRRTRSGDDEGSEMRTMARAWASAPS
eukprot:scaffold63491_cov51-Phaeocystis_antarctica.AAC.1